MMMMISEHIDVLFNSDNPVVFFYTTNKIHRPTNVI